VVLSECHENGHNATRDDPNGEIIDMSGPAAEIGIYGNTHNIVLLPHPAGRARLQDYRKALKIAGLKTATYLARAGHGLNPDEVEVYDLSPVAKTVKGLEDLPRVAYIFQILSMQFAPIPGDPVLYGSNVDGIVPTVLHPNEVLDGAVCNPCRGNLLVETYVIQNQPIIKELYRRHGRDLNFAGVIIATAHNNPPEYERTAYMAAHLSKWVLGADGVIVTKAGGGAPEVSMSQIALRCEEIGVNSAIAMAHMAADANDTSSEASVIFNMPELNAIVSMGDPWMKHLKLPPMKKIIGRAVNIPGGSSVSDEHVRPLRWIKGSVSQMGISKLTAARY
jgi:glycine reductase